MRSEHVMDGWWTLPGKPVSAMNWPGTKNAQSHRVWLPKAAQQIIEEMDSTGLVFASSRGNAITGLSNAMRDICQKLEVERATPHDLRRTHGSTITRLGFGRADIYDRHEYADENKKIMEAVAFKFTTLIEGGTPDNVVAFVKV